MSRARPAHRFRAWRYLGLTAVLAGLGWAFVTRSAPVLPADPIASPSTVALALGPVPAALPSAVAGQVLERSFWSAALERELPYSVYLPVGYAATSRRYPVLYMLHGLGGDHLNEWRSYGLLDAASSLLDAALIQPLIIVLPEGEDGYWVDHADGGPRWGTYVARDLVTEIDTHFLTLDDAASRAIGGNSMGAHGAIQLAINFPGRFGVVGIHSPTLRGFGDAPAFFGDRASFEARDPASLIRRYPEAARTLRISLDAGDRDPWLPATTSLHEQLLDSRVPHDFVVSPGVHDDPYWTASVSAYLRFYSAALSHDREVR